MYFQVGDTVFWGEPPVWGVVIHIQDQSETMFEDDRIVTVRFEDGTEGTVYEDGIDYVEQAEL
jgi:hypothetical protein